MDQVDWAKVKQGIEAGINWAFEDPRDLFFTDETTGVAVFDALESEHGLSFALIILQEGGAGLQVSFEGDADVVWTGDLEDLKDDAKAGAVADAAVKAAQAMLGS